MNLTISKCEICGDLQEKCNDIYYKNIEPCERYLNAEYGNYVCSTHEDSFFEGVSLEYCDLADFHINNIK